MPAPINRAATPNPAIAQAGNESPCTGAPAATGEEGRRLGLGLGLGLALVVVGGVTAGAVVVPRVSVETVRRGCSGFFCSGLV
jgi:hypothetical protein